MTVIAFSVDGPTPYGKPDGEVKQVRRDLLVALAATATHVTERYDVTLGNSTVSKVEWRCRQDCPLCLVNEILGLDSPL